MDEYVPNFQCIKIQTECSNTDVFRIREGKRTLAAQQCFAAIKAMDVDDTYRAELGRNLPWQLRKQLEIKNDENE